MRKFYTSLVAAAFLMLAASCASTQLNLETNLFETKSGKMIWSTTSETFEPNPSTPSPFHWPKPC